MKRILVPTDFSPIADNAMHYAIELASLLGSEIFLYHVYSLHRKVDYNHDYSMDEQPYVKKLEQQMEEKALRFKDKLEQKGLAFQTHVEEDSVLSLFGRKAKKHHIDLIVMGSKGASGMQKVLFGSVAATALEMAKVPVLVVPPDHSFSAIQKIAVATDLHKVKQGILKPLQKLASASQAEVTLLNVKSNPKQASTADVDLHLQGVPTTFSEIPMSHSINESINDFVVNHKMDLICMIRREKGFFESLFKKSITISQVYNSKIPLLVLPEHK